MVDAEGGVGGVEILDQCADFLDGGVVGVHFGGAWEGLMGVCMDVLRNKDRFLGCDGFIEDAWVLGVGMRVD